MAKKKNDFLKFVCFVKGALISAEVIKKGGGKLTNEAKYYFNQVYNSCRIFEKFIEQSYTTPGRWWDGKENVKNFELDEKIKSGEVVVDVNKVRVPNAATSAILAASRAAGKPTPSPSDIIKIYLRQKEFFDSEIAKDKK